MKRIPKYLTAFFIFLLIANGNTVRPVLAEIARYPVYAGSFYPKDAEELARMIENFTQQAGKHQLTLPRNKELRALILPHAGYMYSGLTAAYASHVLHKNQFSKVILMGPDHRVGFNNGAISDADVFITPLGPVAVHPDVTKLKQNISLYQSIPESDSQEHSLEVILPFLQTYLQDFQFIPLVLGPGDIRAYTQSLESAGVSDALLVASSDLSHYLSYDKAVQTDKETINMILNLQSESFSRKQNAACGRTPILILMNLAKKYKWQPVLLHYSNSGDTAGPRDKVVGYAAIAFYGDVSMTEEKNNNGEFSENNGQTLVKLARQTIGEHLKQNVEIADATEKELKAPEFQRHRGTFVTLHKNGQLRGCIGSLTANEPLADSVRHNAINAAFRDPRFPPLSSEELAEVDIEVSILSEPQPLAYEDGNDLISKLRVDVDGVILRKGSHGATFLPQVWKQLPNPKDFLSHLCRKAGLPPDAWQTSKLEISTYQVEYFEEK